MPAKKHDYAVLEREFINSTISIRALARKHEIDSYSTVAVYAKNHGWLEKRQKIQASTEEKVIAKVSERLAETEADELVEFRGMGLAVIKGALVKFAADLENPDYHILPNDLMKLISQGLLLLGQPTSRTEERHLELTGSLNGLPDELLRRLAEVSRPRQLESGSVGLAAPGGDKEARPN